MAPVWIEVMRERVDRVGSLYRRVRGTKPAPAISVDQREAVILGEVTGYERTVATPRGPKLVTGRATVVEADGDEMCLPGGTEVGDRMSIRGFSGLAPGLVEQVGNAVELDRAKKKARLKERRS
ncbi:hypothetical protein A2634_01040 [Candidatus Amesbacteria bacterium RIFCSPHIGHO2_01_FULL_48_32]|uniref:Uncharacterized protein n=1 Tax=Candidatus Amesbacteria bacterium RIFCSPLOWO2_01_FULL_48_25 TaxID=1797259 RepID=A0A1F4ZBQ6_9BACT|nr:MAG: hypothetical protein A2634_01040 [Candidatus Amesbacteria bacterium RIFCSPHIGHO2_01_FULL_48_32]OGD03625.1 MAG: hypothetical protein A2989_03020 [Candidatus Amesbacteria bacterium RIFCSPLOWO2_01_FULL_48_25]HJZ06028.1 hypothetical protein [Patescibacteria group bacterium]